MNVAPLCTAFSAACRSATECPVWGTWIGTLYQQRTPGRSHPHRGPLTYGHADALGCQCLDHFMAAAQLRGQRHDADIVQGAIGGQHVTESIGFKGAEVGLRVCTPLLPADERTLQVHPWEKGQGGSSRHPHLGAPPQSLVPAQPPSPTGHLEGEGPPRQGQGEGQPLTEDPCPMGTSTLHGNLRKDLGGTSC
jgi:hypothetical protein